MQTPTNFCAAPKAVDGELHEDNVALIVRDLRDVKTEIGLLDLEAACAVQEGIDLLEDPTADPTRIRSSEKLGGAFGRGIQYVSLVKGLSYEVDGTG